MVATLVFAQVAVAQSAGRSCEDIQAMLDGGAPSIDSLTPEELVACGENLGTGSEASSSATAAAASSPTVVVLPETGGPTPAALALPSFALLIVSGIFAARLVRN
jgi:hypothetical protein